MRLLTLAALFAVAVASGHPGGDAGKPKLWPWKAGKLYRYDVESQTLARLHEGASSGNAFKARLIVRARSPSLLQAKLEDPQYAQVHQDVFDNKLPKDLKYEALKNIDQPFEIKVEGGRVLSVALASSVSLPYENILKGLVGALQVDLSTYRNVQSSHDHFDSESYQGLFKKMEIDVTGDCETLYTVSPVASEWRRELPIYALEKEEPIEITKSKNYGHCNHRVDYHFGVPGGAKWTGTAHNADEEQFIKRATVSRMLCGKEGPIYKSETTSTVHVHPHLYGKQKAEVRSHVRLYLTAWEQDNEGEWQKPENERIVKSLLYSLSSKKITITETSSSESSEERPRIDITKHRVRRSSHKIFGMKNKGSDESSDSSSSSSSSSSPSSSNSSPHINDEVPTGNEPAYAAMYMHPQTHADKKQNPMTVHRLVQEIAQQIQNPNNIPKADILAKFNILVRVIASMSFGQLNQTSRSIEAGKSSDNFVKSDMWRVYRDAVTQAGTLPAFQLIKSWIQSKILQEEEAAQAIASLATSLRYPTKKTMTEFFNLAISEEVKQQKELNITALIAATRFINMGHVNNYTAHSRYPTHMYGRLCRKHDRFVVQEVLPRLSHELEKAFQQKDTHKTQVYIKVIGNLGHRAILEVFTPYLEGKVEGSSHIRALIVDSLQVLAQEKDHHVRNVLFSILKNTAEPYEVRLAAILTIFMANPTSSMIQAMATMSNNDPSIRVRAAIKSAIETAAELKNPHYLDLARKAEAAKCMLTEERFGKADSSMKYVDSYDRDFEYGIFRVLSLGGSVDSLYPKYFKYTVKSKIEGWDKETTISGAFSSIRHFYDFLKQEVIKERPSPKSESNHKYSADKVAEMLNIKPYPESPLAGIIFTDLMNQQRLYSFSEDDMMRMSMYLGLYMMNINTSGAKTYYTKILYQNQVSIMFPVAMGVPFILKYKEPVLIHTKSKAIGKIVAPTPVNKTYSLSMEKDINIIYARNLDGQVGFLDTLSNQHASVGVINKFQIYVPLKLHFDIKHKEAKIRLEPLYKDQDATVMHYSVWPYTANQKLDTLTLISHDPTTKVVKRNKKVVSIDAKSGQHTGVQFLLQGYSYSQDYRKYNSMFPTKDLGTNIALALVQKDVALTHYNLRYLGKQSQNTAVNLHFVYDKILNLKQNGNTDLVANEMQDVTPNSETRRAEMLKRVVSGMKTATGQVVDVSAVFEGSQKMEYVATAAIGSSPIDSKIQYAFFGCQNSKNLGIKQLNAVGTVVKPTITALNPFEALKKDLKMTFEADIKWGEDNKKDIHITGYTERSKEFTEELQKQHFAKQCAKEIESNNFYQDACHKLIVKAHAPDYLKASVVHGELSPGTKNTSYHVYRMLQHIGFWYSSVNPLKKLPEGRFEIEALASYSERSVDFTLTSKSGEIQFKKVPIPKVAPYALAVYPVFRPKERVLNHYTRHMYQPYCTVDGTMVRTFSNRSYEYTVTRSWHVVLHDDAKYAGKYGSKNEKLVVLARRPNEKQQEVYISYVSNSGKDMEIEIQQGKGKPVVKVTTKCKKITEGELTIYKDDDQDEPYLQYYTQSDGVLILQIGEKRLRIMYDSERLVVLTRENRGNIRGICGQMSGEPRDDYLTPDGVVDKPEHYAASYALSHKGDDPKTQELKAEAKKAAYKHEHRYTVILRSDKDWFEAIKPLHSSKEDWGSQMVYKTRSYGKSDNKKCELQQQVQYYENLGEICISIYPLPVCPAGCRVKGHKVVAAEVVCKIVVDEEQIAKKKEILEGSNPTVTGVTKTKLFRIATGCIAL